MAIAYVDSGGQASGTTSLSLAYPAVVTAGNLLVCAIANKYPTNGPSTPSGWTAPTNNQGSGGSGSAGADTGNTYATVFVKIADGTETGNLAVTITSGNSARGSIHQLSKSSTRQWYWACINGASNTPGTAWTSAFGSDPGIRSGDELMHVAAPNADTYTYTAHTFIVPGITAGTVGSERADGAGASGDQCRYVVADWIATGTAFSNAAPSVTMTASGSAANAPAGGAVLLVLREIVDVTGSGGMTLGGSATTSFEENALGGVVAIRRRRR